MYIVKRHGTQTEGKRFANGADAAQRLVSAHLFTVSRTSLRSSCRCGLKASNGGLPWDGMPRKYTLPSLRSCKQHSGLRLHAHFLVAPKCSQAISTSSPC